MLSYNSFLYFTIFIPITTAVSINFYDTVACTGTAADISTVEEGTCFLTPSLPVSLQTTDSCENGKRVVVNAFTDEVCTYIINILINGDTPATTPASLNTSSCWHTPRGIKFKSVRISCEDLLETSATGSLGGQSGGSFGGNSGGSFGGQGGVTSASSSRRESPNSLGTESTIATRSTSTNSEASSTAIVSTPPPSSSAISSSELSTESKISLGIGLASVVLTATGIYFAYYMCVRKRRKDKNSEHGSRRRSN